MKRSILFLCILVLTVICLPSSVLADGYTKSEIKMEAKALIEKLEISKDVVYRLTGKLDTTLEDPIVNDAIDSKGANALFVYRSGEGGVVVKFMKGDGLISFKTGIKAGSISLKSWSAGALIGGSAQWGIGIVLGLANQSEFGGDYKGTVKGATAAETTTAGFLVLTHDSGKSKQEIVLITSGRGLSAGVGGEKMTIIPNW